MSDLVIFLESVCVGRVMVSVEVMEGWVGGGVLLLVVFFSFGVCVVFFVFLIL